jgi:hypothetical protein
LAFSPHPVRRPSHVGSTEAATRDVLVAAEQLTAEATRLRGEVDRFLGSVRAG